MTATANRRGELVRLELMKQAADLFTADGYDRVSFEDITKAVGLSRSALYHYFPSKEAIVSALVDEEANAALESTERAMNDTDKSPSERLRAAARSGILHQLRDDVRPRLLEQLEGVMTPESRARLGSMRHIVLDLYTKTIAAGTETGEFRVVDPRMAAFAVIGIVRWTAWWYSPGGKKTIEEVADEMVDLALRTVVKTERNDAASADVTEATRLMRAAMLALEGKH
jgi:AcrR family transcriptional regulator